MDIFVESEGFFRCQESLVKITPVKVNLGFCVPSGSKVRSERQSLGNQAEGVLVFTEGKLENRVINKALRGNIGHRVLR